MATADTEATDTVVVTGGCGCLGQHMIQMLQLRADHVKEIRVLDLKPYTNILGHVEQKPVKSIVGSVCNPEDIRRAFQGATTVFHLAAVVDYGTCPNAVAMDEVNVKGTSNVIDACIDENVKRLVFSSSMDVLCGHDGLDMGTDRTELPRKFLFNDYSTSKWRAETMVNEANGKKLQNGDALKTISIRPCGIYGEGDEHFVTYTLKKAASLSKGYLAVIGNTTNLMTQAYAGNLAWGFLCADLAIQQSEHAAGNAFILCDDTPDENVFSFMRPFTEDHGMQFLNIRIPYWLAFWSLYLFSMFIRLISPIYKINIEITHEFIIRLCKNFTLRDDRARTVLGYSPIVSPEEAYNRSKVFYSQLPVWNNKAREMDTNTYTQRFNPFQELEDINRNVQKGLD